MQGGKFDVVSLKLTQVQVTTVTNSKKISCKEIFFWRQFSSELGNTQMIWRTLPQKANWSFFIEAE